MQAKASEAESEMALADANSAMPDAGDADVLAEHTATVADTEPEAATESADISTSSAANGPLEDTGSVLDTDKVLAAGVSEVSGEQEVTETVMDAEDAADPATSIDAIEMEDALTEHDADADAANETDDAIMAEAEAALVEAEAESAAAAADDAMANQAKAAEAADAQMDTEAGPANKIETGEEARSPTGNGGAATSGAHKTPVRTPSMAAAVAAAAKAAAAAAAAGGGPASTQRPTKPRKPIGTGRRSRQARRDPQEPVNPRSAYTIFVKEKMEELGVHIKDSPDLKLKGKEQIKVVAQQWRDLSAEEKERYQQMFTKAFAAYEQDLAAYKQTDSYRLFQGMVQLPQGLSAAPVPVSGAASQPLLTATPIRLESLNQFLPMSQLQHLLPPG
uniref:HMG box domain-containing protein n=1 Tax=Macrostomum lignano TaxID=282301 RepID=A0A1I8FUW9_9PLAT